MWGACVGVYQLLNKFSVFMKHGNLQNVHTSPSLAGSQPANPVEICSHYFSNQQFVLSSQTRLGFISG